MVVVVCHEEETRELGEGTEKLEETYEDGKEEDKGEGLELVDGIE